MSMITKVPKPNIWDLICKDFASERPPFRDDDDASSVHTHYSDYDPARHNPVFYQDNKLHIRVKTDCQEMEDFDPARYHPSIIGHAFVDRPPPQPPVAKEPPPPKDTCLPREYLEHYIFPVLLPAMEEMLKRAKIEKCFERKRTKFNALDFLTEYLYSHNKAHENREGKKLEDIPFVQEYWKEHPRPPLPKSLLWTEEEGSLLIQSFWRGYKVRRQPEVQELREWQKEWREENANIQERVQTFWEVNMPNGLRRSSELFVEESNTESQTTCADGKPQIPFATTSADSVQYQEE